MIFLQRLIPQHTISNIIFKFSRLEIIWIKNLFLSWFINKYKVDLTQAQRTNISDYRSINDFFTRSLKSELRTIAKQDLVCPVDGLVVQAGYVNRINKQIKAKGHNYSLEALLAEKISYNLDNLYTTTMYLSPKDYHRIHMPFDAELVNMKYIPGKLFSVNQKSCNVIEGIFARNERLVCRFKTSFGEAFIILIGAIMVGSMEVVWQGQITPAYGKKIVEYKYQKQQIKLSKGEEMGRFNMGSSVIMLLPNFDKNINLRESQSVVFGQSII